MADPAYQSALARGAVQFVSRLVSGGTSPFQIVNMIRRAYPGMNPTEYGSVYQTGLSAYTAAQEVTGPLGTGLAPLANIPVNPNLFQGVSTGNQFRFQTLVTYQIPGETGSRFATLNINTPQNLSAADLRAIANAQFDQLINRRSPKMPNYMPGPPIVQSIDLLDLERQF